MASRWRKGWGVAVLKVRVSRAGLLDYVGVNAARDVKVLNGLVLQRWYSHLEH